MCLFILFICLLFDSFFIILVNNNFKKDKILFKKMKVQKVFETNQKKLNEKPAYVKPKYKTYRELLELDKPKRII